jgi:hypothetical protein
MVEYLNMNKKQVFTGFFIVEILSSLLIPIHAYAICPVCIVAVGAGVGLSRWLGISDLITGLWVGALLLAMSFWLSIFLRKRKINLPFQKTVITITMFLITFGPLHMSKVIGHPLNRLFGIDKLFFGSIIGSVLFVIGVIIDHLIREGNGGKVRFFYQKVVIPVGLLLIFSFLFFLAKI